ncbi:MAG: glutaminyl-peptide cyclotransferase [Planctomycetaceae bacterium]|jgi:glutamine cyclotransferase|nr:glutaminyl-peptide cyclotransferase [Planctomycetaceae bacterium]
MTQKFRIDAETNNVYITGKNWNVMYVLRLTAEK